MSTWQSLSIGEIFQRIRQTYVGEQKKDLLIVRYLYRPLSFPLSVVPLLLKLRPNQVTFANFLLVVAAFVVFCLGDKMANWVGVGIFLMIFVIDCVDGNMARFLDQRRYFGKLVDGLVDVFVFSIYIAIAIGNVAAGDSAFSPENDLLAGATITLAMTFSSYFRMRLAHLLGEIRQRETVTPTIPRSQSVSTRKRLVLGLRGFYENLGPLGPILLAVALFLDGVSQFLLLYAIVFVAFSAAEVFYGLYHYREPLSVARPSNSSSLPKTERST